MTLREALDVALAAYDEDEGEREAILAALAPVLLGDRALLTAAIIRVWEGGAWRPIDGGMRQDGLPRPDEIREVLAAYQTERAEIDAEIVTTARERAAEITSDSAARSGPWARRSRD